MFIFHTNLNCIELYCHAKFKCQSQWSCLWEWNKFQVAVFKKWHSFTRNRIACYQWNWFVNEMVAVFILTCVLLYDVVFLSPFRVGIEAFFFRLTSSCVFFYRFIFVVVVAAEFRFLCMLFSFPFFPPFYVSLIIICIGSAVRWADEINTSTDKMRRQSDEYSRSHLAGNAYQSCFIHLLIAHCFPFQFIFLFIYLPFYCFLLLS